MCIGVIFCCVLLVLNGEIGPTLPFILISHWLLTLFIICILQFGHFSCLLLEWQCLSPSLFWFYLTGKISVVGNEYDEHDKPSKLSGGMLNNKTEREILPPPPPPPKNNLADSFEKQQPAVAREEENDIFVGHGIDYEVPGKDMSQSPLSEDMEESPRNKERLSYFSEPAYGPVPPSELSHEWQDPVSWSYLIWHLQYLLSCRKKYSQFILQLPYLLALIKSQLSTNVDQL